MLCLMVNTSADAHKSGLGKTEHNNNYRCSQMLESNAIMCAIRDVGGGNNFDLAATKLYCCHEKDTVT
jgi:hypothetical protein